MASRKPGLRGLQATAGVPSCVRCPSPMRSSLGFYPATAAPASGDPTIAALNLTPACRNLNYLRSNEPLAKLPAEYGPRSLFARNGGGFVRRKSNMNWSHIAETTAKWRRAPFGAELGGWLYGEIEPALLVEPFLGSSSQLPVDYKFWTFGGKAKIVEVVTDRESGLKSTMFDLDWRRLPFSVGFPADPRPLSKPASLHRMFEAAEILAELGI